MTNGDAIEHGEWWEYSRPFRHFRATDVLPSEAYRAVASAFTAVVETTDGKRVGPYRLAKGSANYDAAMLAVDARIALEFSPFFSMTWLSSLYKLLGIPFLGRIDGGLHSSKKGSRTGWVHTDYCSAWFDESRQTDDIILFPDRKRCDYFKGNKKVNTAVPKEYVRAATLIFFLCNDDWKPGDGGETALYAASRPSPETSFDLVPPVNNSLLLFECSPHSYHRFITNPGRTRNSIILWLHSTLEDTHSRWGDAVNRRSPR